MYTAKHGLIGLNGQVTKPGVGQNFRGYIEHLAYLQAAYRLSHEIWMKSVCEASSGQGRMAERQNGTADAERPR